MNLHHLGSSFSEGIELLLSPSTLGLLALILAAGVQGGKRRPYGLMVGFILAFIFLSLHPDHLLNDFQDLSGFFLVIFGVFLLIDLNELFEMILKRFARFWQKFSDGLVGGGVFGFASVLIWSSGIQMEKYLVRGFDIRKIMDVQTAVVLSLGLSLLLLAITLLSRHFLEKYLYVAPREVLFRKIIRKIGGLVIIASTFIITKGWVVFMLISLFGGRIF